MIEAHTLKAMSDEFRRPSLAVGGYKTVGEAKVMSVSNQITLNPLNPNELVAGQRYRIKSIRSNAVAKSVRSAGPFAIRAGAIRRDAGGIYS